MSELIKSNKKQWLELLFITLIFYHLSNALLSTNLDKVMIGIVDTPNKQTYHLKNHLKYVHKRHAFLDTGLVMPPFSYLAMTDGIFIPSYVATYSYRNVALSVQVGAVLKECLPTRIIKNSLPKS